MIEIIALIFLSRKIGALALQKGQAARAWKINMILAWFVFEITGFFIGLVISGNPVMALLLGLASAFGGYLLMKYRLEKMPDAGGNNLKEQYGRD